MSFPFPTQEIVEGRARLLVPAVPSGRGPGTRGPWPFYNATMAVSRDVSAIVLARWPARLGSVLDALAATGAWGIRMGLETQASGLVFNDRTAHAASLIRENLRRNRVSGEVHARDARDLLRRGPYDFVDLDPFGPPTPFLGDAIAAARPGSGLGVTATDTAPLCGTYPSTCVRRYGARPLRCDQGAEIGVRILVGYAARLAEAHGKSLRPLLAFAAAHFLRFLAIVGPAGDRAPLARVVREPSGEFRTAEDAGIRAIGPLWLGPLTDPEFAQCLEPSPWTGNEAARLLSVLKEEAALPPFFFTTDELARRLRGGPPTLDAFVAGLRTLGFRAARTHFHPRGVRTDAPLADVVRVCRETMPSGSTDGSGPAR